MFTYDPLLFLEEIKASPTFYIPNIVAEFSIAIRQLHQIFVPRQTFILVPETAALADLIMLLKLLATAAAAALLVHASAIILLHPVLAHARCADVFLLV